MPKCKNDEESSYTGKEPSPKGKGYSAKKEKIGTKKRGRDGNIWIVKKRVNGIKSWARFSTKKKIIKKKGYMIKKGGNSHLYYEVKKDDGYECNIEVRSYEDDPLINIFDCKLLTFDLSEILFKHCDSDDFQEFQIIDINSLLLITKINEGIKYYLQNNKTEFNLSIIDRINNSNVWVFYLFKLGDGSSIEEIHLKQSKGDRKPSIVKNIILKRKEPLQSNALQSNALQSKEIFKESFKILNIPRIQDKTIMAKIYDFNLKIFVEETEGIDFTTITKNTPAQFNMGGGIPEYKKGDKIFPDRQDSFHLMKEKLYNKIKSVLSKESNYNSHTFERPLYFIGGYDNDISENYFERNLWTETFQKGIPNREIKDMYWSIGQAFLNSLLFNVHWSGPAHAMQRLPYVISTVIVFKILEQPDTDYVNTFNHDSYSIPDNCTDYNKICGRKGYKFKNASSADLPDAYIFRPDTMIKLKLVPKYIFRFINDFSADKEINKNIFSIFDLFELDSIRFKYYKDSESKEFKEFDPNCFGSNILLEILHKSIFLYYTNYDKSKYMKNSSDYLEITGIESQTQGQTQVRGHDPTIRYVQIDENDNGELSIYIRLFKTDTEFSIAIVKPSVKALSIKKDSLDKKIAAEAAEAAEAVNTFESVTLDKKLSDAGINLQNDINQLLFEWYQKASYKKPDNPNKFFDSTNVSLIDILYPAGCPIKGKYLEETIHEMKYLLKYNSDWGLGITMKGLNILWTIKPYIILCAAFTNYKDNSFWYLSLKHEIFNITLTYISRSFLNSLDKETLQTGLTKALQDENLSGLKGVNNNELPRWWLHNHKVYTESQPIQYIIKPTTEKECVINSLIACFGYNDIRFGLDDLYNKYIAFLLKCDSTTKDIYTKQLKALTSNNNVIYYNYERMGQESITLTVASIANELFERLYKILQTQLVENQGEIQIIRQKTIDFCTGIKLNWFLEDNQALLTEGKAGIGNLIKTNEEMCKFTDSSCILSSYHPYFIQLLKTIRTNDRYREYLKNVKNVTQMIQRLIYNRPLSFVGPEDRDRGMTRPGNKDALNNVAGEFDPYLCDGRDEKYELISLAALLGCWSLTPIIHSGIKSMPGSKNDLNLNRERENKFFTDNKKDGNYNTTAYVCGLVGARFEKSNQMEDAYIRESPAKNNPIHEGLRKFFEYKISLNKNKYQHTYNGSQSAINKRNLYRERIRFTFEIFLAQCYNTSINKKQKICPVFTGLGAGVWADDSGIKPSIPDIIEDSILSILTDNPHYLEEFPAIRLSSIGEYTDIDGPDIQSGIPLRDLKLGSISEEFNNKYRVKYPHLFNGDFKIFHTHWCKKEPEPSTPPKKTSPQSFLTQEELKQLIGDSGGSGNNLKEAFLFAWDGNSFVGNEYWYKYMDGSGDPVTISSCCLGQLCNPFINDKMLKSTEPQVSKEIDVSSGEATNIYFIKVENAEGSPFKCIDVKNIFIEKVIDELTENKLHTIFHPINEPLINLDCIVFNGKNLIYHDGYYKTYGIILNHNREEITL
jgi:hypothetical protein